MSEWVAVSVALATGYVFSSFVAILALRAPDPVSLRTNVEGLQVPVVLGWCVVVGALAGLGVVVVWTAQWLPAKVMAPLIAITFAVGWWDDRKGDERPRGFSGHLGALRGGSVTGGVVKLIGGGAAGVVTMVVLLGGLSPLTVLLLGAATIALAANLINLFDRAPGRASKVFLIGAIPLAVLSPDWRLLAAGAIGAVLASLILDLAAKAMLGDAGANPMGALLGLGLVFASRGSTPNLLAMVVVLLALNLVSEKVSFSKVIEQSPWLARLDHLGRK